MRILTITKDLGPGGQQRTAQNCVLGYRERGHENAVLSVLEGGTREDALREANVPIFIGNDAPAKAAQQAADWAPDLIHLHSKGPPKPYTRRVLRMLQEAVPKRLPVIESNSFGKVNYAADRADIDVHMLKSRWSLWRWRQWTRILRPAPIGTMIPNTVDTKSFYPAHKEERRAFRKAHDLPSDAFVFGRIGQPLPAKWSPMIFEAFAEVALHHENAHLLIVGLPDELRQHMNKLAPTVRTRIREIPFLHGDEALRHAYSSMDVFLHAAHIGESFGMVLAEAMSCECPVISLSRPHKDNAQLEVVGHERGGLVVNDRGSMIRAMRRLMGDAALRQSLAEGGAKHVQNTYTLDQVMPRLLKVAKLAVSTDTREALKDALREDPDLITDVSDEEIADLLKRSMGRIPFTQRMLMRLVHVPWIYRLWTWYRFGR